MQACRALRPSATTARTSLPLPALPPRPRQPSVDSNHRRFLTDVATTESKTLYQPDSSSNRTRASILLHKTTSLLPRALPIADGAVGPESFLFWSNILERTIVELDSGPDQVPTKATVAVCGFDEWARSHHLVTALLEDPFASDPTYSEMLRDRWKDSPSCVNIEYGKPAAFSGELSSTSNWLQRFPHPIRLTEFPDLSSLSSINDETDSLLLNSDILLLLCDPVVTPLSDLVIRAKHLLNRPNTILVLTSGSIPDPDRSQFVSRLLLKVACQPGYILYVDPRQALGAVTALQANPTSPSVIDRYQRDSLASQMSTISATINEILSPKSPSETSLMQIREGTILSQVHSSLVACSDSVGVVEKDVNRVASNVEGLLYEIRNIREDTKHAVLGKPSEESEVEKALSRSTKDMSALLESLTFWKMVWRVDEIGALISTAIQGRWCKGLENQLILQTGCLECTQRELSVSTSKILSIASSTSLRSVVLENQLEQLKHSPSHSLMPNSLIQPIHNRRNQLIQHTTTKLHREAQSAVAGVFSGVLSGAGLGWWLAFGEHITGLGISTEIGSAVGFGALLALSSIRWAVGKWERAKQRWTQDLGRIGEGLTRDLHSTVQSVVDEHVTIVASTACKGIQDLISKRRNEVRQLRGELSELNADLRSCPRFPAPWLRESLRSLKE